MSAVRTRSLLADFKQMVPDVLFFVLTCCFLCFSSTGEGEVITVITGSKHRLC